MPSSIAEGARRLTDAAVVRIQGPDAASFLHGQLTNAVQDLPHNPDRARPAAYCSAQGRLLANGVLWARSEDDIALVVSRDLTASLISRLRMFVLRAKVSIETDDSLTVAGMIGADHLPARVRESKDWTRTIQGKLDWIKVPVAPEGLPMALCIGLADDLPTAATDNGAWNASRLHAGWPWVRVDTRETFLPAALDMDLNGTIDFGKGCYPGQEIIARSHYRGTVKRGMAYGTAPWDSPTPPAGATDLFNPDQPDSRPNGRIIESACHAGCLHVTAEITLSDWPGTRYAVGAPDGAILRLEKPSREAGEKA